VGVGPKTDRINPIYYRKCTVFTTFTVRFRRVNDAVLIDLAREHAVSEGIVRAFINDFKNNANKESFITPQMAMNIVDYIYLNKHRNTISKEVCG
jgi:hypothetical protein